MDLQGITEKSVSEFSPFLYSSAWWMFLRMRRQNLICDLRCATTMQGGQKKITENKNNNEAKFYSCLFY